MRLLGSVFFVTVLCLFDLPVSAQLGSLDAAAASAGANVSSAAPPPTTPVVAGDPASALADQLVLTQMRTIDKADRLSAPTFSADGSRLYYGRSSDGKHMVVIRDMTSGRVVGTVELRSWVTGLALSPDEQRLLICSANSPGNVGTVHELKTGRSIELPVSFGGCDSGDRQPVSWVDENTVIFDGTTLDLVNLESHRQPDRAYPARSGSSYSTHANAFYSDEAGGQRGLWVCDRESEYCHLALATTEPWVSTKNLRQVVLLDYCMGCKPAFTLHELKLAVRARPIREFSLTVNYDDLGSSSYAHPESLKKCRAGKPQLFGRVTGPKVNPLNQKVIGGDGSNKGTLRLTRTADPLRHRAVLIREMAPVAVGDVVDALWSPGECSLLGTQMLVLRLEPAIENPGLPGSDPHPIAAPASAEPGRAVPVAPSAGENLAPVQIGEGISPPIALNRITPFYTESARRRRLQGTVVLEVVVDRQGNVGEVRIVDGLDSGLDENAKIAVRRLRFKPAHGRDGRPLSVYLRLRVDYRLD